MKKESPTPKIPKEYLLLIVGALISLSTTLIINYANTSKDRNAQLRMERIEFADYLCRSLASRINYVGNFINAKIFDIDTVGYNHWSNLNLKMNNELAANVFYNSSRLKVLYNDDLYLQFKDSIDRPFDEFNKTITFTRTEKLDKTIIKKDWAELNERIGRFSKKLYSEAFKF